MPSALESARGGGRPRPLPPRALGHGPLRRALCPTEMCSVTFTDDGSRVEPCAILLGHNQRSVMAITPRGRG